MLILPLFIIAIAAFVFGVHSLIKKRLIVGILFSLMGVMLFALGLVTVHFYPHTWPF